MLVALVLLLIFLVVANTSLERKSDRLTYQLLVNYKLAVDTMAKNLRVLSDPDSSHQQRVDAVYWITIAKIQLEQFPSFDSGIAFLSRRDRDSLGECDFWYYDWLTRLNWRIVIDELTPGLIDYINRLITTFEALSLEFDKILNLGERGISKKIRKGNSEFVAAMSEISTILREEVWADPVFNR